MELKVHCPSETCRATLTVPLTASGHVARCPLCHATFLVPTEDEIAEQTASAWIEDDIEDLKDQIDTEWQQRLKDEAIRRAQQEELRRQETAREIGKIMAGNKQAIDANHPVFKDGQAATQVATPSARPLTPNSADTAQAVPDQPTATIAANQSPQTATATAQVVAPPTDWAPAAPAQPTTASASKADAPPQENNNNETIAPGKAKAPRQSHVDEYPTELVIVEPKPYLIVTQCKQSGVELSFDSRFLMHDGFRLSMPVACAFTGDTDRDKLVARPLAFLDQTKGELRNAYDVESGHEAKLNQSLTGKEMLSRMGVIEQLPDPFRYPFPYYVRTDHTNQSLKCYTTRSGDGPTVAHVQISDGPLAMRWLRHVNGVCGREYELLSRDIAYLWQGEWVDMHEQVRRRIEVWARFQNGEKFRYFINDADIPKKDEGLAGVVLTDRRLIYKKFHRQGQVEYGTHAQLIIRPDGTMAGLRVKTEEGTFKCARFHFSDLQKLKDAAKDLGFGLDIAQ